MKGDEGMAKKETKERNLDERVKRILEYLAHGLSRDEVAEKFRYTSYRSMDILMRRKNYKWDKQAGTYVPISPSDDAGKGELMVPSDKVRRILSELGKEGANLKEVAKKMEFESHMELATYMKSKGYEWSEEEGNYVRSACEDSAESEVEGENQEQGKVFSLQDYQQRKAERSSFERFIPILELLETHFDQLQGLLIQGQEIGQIPRFTLPGRFVTKSVHMTDTLDLMVRDFSKEKNVNQREIFEVALIEFFQKYGFSREVGTLLKRR